MPPRSQAQARWAFANQDKAGKLGEAAREFVPHGEGSMSKLPKLVKKGRISRKAAERLSSRRSK